jgi:hypothetical protein
MKLLPIKNCLECTWSSARKCFHRAIGIDGRELNNYPFKDEPFPQWCPLDTRDDD